MGRRSTSYRYALAAALLTAGAAQGQSDPFGGLYAGQGQSTAVGATSVETAVGRSYAGSQEKGAVSLAQIGFLPKTVAPFAIELDGWNEKFLSRRPRIAIAAYGFGVARSASASASGAGNGSELTPRRSKLATYLDNVPDDLATRLAEEAYRDLVERLKSAGFEVVSAEEVAASPTMQAVARHPGPVAGKAGGASWITYAPAAAPLIKGYANEGGLGALAASGASMKLGQASKDLDAVVLLPRLMVDNVAMQSSGQRMFVANASVDAKVRFSLTGASRTDFIWGNDRGGAMPGAFTMKPYGSPEPFAVMVKASDRSDSKALHNALADAGFGSLYRQSLVYAVEADPGRFTALSRAAFQGYNAALVEEIRRARNP